jgi:hypothetical protein
MGCIVESEVESLLGTRIVLKALTVAGKDSDSEMKGVRIPKASDTSEIELKRAMDLARQQSDARHKKRVALQEKQVHSESWCTPLTVEKLIDYGENIKEKVDVFEFRFLIGMSVKGNVLPKSLKPKRRSWYEDLKQSYSSVKAVIATYLEGCQSSSYPRSQKSL